MRRVFELPMRDGNFVDGRMLHISEKFLNFLGGMETILGRDTKKLCKYVFELPMRDGNLVRIINLKHLTDGFGTSYEGWKLEEQKPNKQIHVLVFELPMRDGNDRSKYMKQAGEIVFELPMRDGNNFKNEKYISPPKTFLNFLGGMETEYCFENGT